MAGIQIRNADEFEQRVAGLPPGPPPANVTFRILPEISLDASSQLKLQVQPGGTTGYRLCNPELLETKVRAYYSVEDDLERMIQECSRRLEVHIDDANACITRLQRLLRIEDANMPQLGPALVNCGKGLHHYIHPMPPQPNPFWELDTQQVGAVVADATQGEQDTARARDLASQRAIWRMNLKAQQKKKDLMTGFAVAIQRGLRELKRELLEEATSVGMGYADFRMLRRANQADFIHPPRNSGIALL